MPPGRGRRAALRTALQALGLAAGVFALLTATGFILASPQVRQSGFGQRMERRFPIRWSELALALGGEQVRVQAVVALTQTRSPRALPALSRAATDRRAPVRTEALDGIVSIGRRARDPASDALTYLCAERRADLRAAAYMRLRDLLLGGAYPRPVRRCLTRGLRDGDPVCRAAAAITAARVVVGPDPDADLSTALAACLLGPSPPPDRLRPPAMSSYLDMIWPNQSTHPWERSGVLHSPAYLIGGRLVCFGGDPRVEARDEGNAWDRTNALVWLWLEGTADSRALIRAELEKRPLD